MKKVTKKIVALCLVFAMCVSGSLANVQVAKAAENVTLGVFNYSSTAQDIYLEGTCSYFTDANAWNVVFRNANGLLLNGEVAGSSLTVAWNGAVYCKLTTAAQVGDVLTVGGEFVTNDGTKSINVETVQFIYKGESEKWVVYTPPEEVSLKIFNYSSTAQDIYMEGTCSYFTDANAWNVALKSSNGILLNGVVAGSGLTVAWNGAVYCKLTTAAQVGDILTVGGEFATNDGAMKINVGTVHYIYKGTTEKWVAYVPPEEVFFTIDNSTSSSSAVYLAGACSYFTNEAAWNTVFKSETGLLLNDEKVAGGITVAGANYGYFALSTQAVAGDVLTITGEFATNDQSKIISVATLQFQYKNDTEKWVEYVPEPEVTPLTLTMLGDYHQDHVIYFKTSVNGTSIDVTKLQPNDENSGIYVNDERVAVSGAYIGQFYREWQYHGYFQLASGVSAGDVVTIKGTFKDTDGTLYSIDEMKLLHTGSADAPSKWIDVTLHTDAGDVTLGVSGIGQTASSFYTAITDSNGIINGTIYAVPSYQAIGADSGVFLNETKLDSANFAPYNWDDDTKVDAGYVVLNQEASVGDKVTIKGTFATKSGDNAYKYIFNIVPFTYQWNGTAWVEYVAPPEVTPLTLTLFTNYHDNHVIYFATGINGLSLTPSDEESGIFLNGNRIAVDGFVGKLSNNWDDKAYFQLAGNAASGAKAGDIATIKGTFDGSDGNLYSISEMKLIQTGSADAPSKWIDVTSHTNVGDATVGLSGVLQKAESFYTTFALSNGSMAGVPAGQITYTAIGADSGVFLNGTKLDAATFAPVAWNAGDNVDAGYVTLGQSAAIGDQVTIKGIFVSKSADNAYKNIFNVVPFTYQWDGTAWVEYINTNTDTVGDVNDDSKFNSLDLVKAMKLFEAGEGANYLNVLDLDCDGVCTVADMAMIRNMLVRGITHIKSFADCPPAPTDTSLRTYFDAGFTTYVLTEDFNDISAEGGKEAYLRFAKKASQYGDIIYRNHVDSNTYWTEKGLTGDYLTSEAQLVNVLGFYQNDEPTLAEIDDMTAIADWQNANAPDKMFHVNLFPSYATSSQIGRDYSAYVQKYVDTVLARVNGPKTLSVDHYALSNESWLNGLITGSNVLRTTYLSDLSIIASAAKTYNETVGISSKITTSIAIQAFNHTDDNKQRDIQSLADINFQVNMALAFGAKQLEYFAYESNNVYHGMVNENTSSGGQIAQGVYDYVKTVNTNLNKWGHIITPFDWQGIYAHKQESNGELSKQTNFTSSLTLAQLNGISNITTTKDTLVSEFKDAEGRYGYMVTNFTDPIDNQSDSVTITLKGASEALVYQNGKAATKISTGATITLNAGEGAFIIPCK